MTIPVIVGRELLLDGRSLCIADFTGGFNQVSGSNIDCIPCRLSRAKEKCCGSLQRAERALEQARIQRQPHRCRDPARAARRSERLQDVPLSVTAFGQ